MTTQTQVPPLKNIKEKPLPTKLDLFQNQGLIEKPQPKPQTTPQPKLAEKKSEYKAIPEETKILLDAVEEIEGILYATRQKIYQLYGLVEYKPVTDIELKFTEHEARILSFEQQGDIWIIRVKQFLEPEDFAKLAAKVRSLGGEYISAGRDSHFKIKRA